MASRAVSLTFHSDDMSAERALARLRSGFGGRRKMGYFISRHFCDRLILLSSLINTKVPTVIYEVNNNNK